MLSYLYSAEAVLNRETVADTAWLADMLMANLPLTMPEDSVRTLCTKVEQSVGRLRKQGRWLSSNEATDEIQRHKGTVCVCVGGEQAIMRNQNQE